VGSSLQDWVISKIFVGDKHITWLVRGDNPFIPKKDRRVKAPTVNKIGATHSLGDNPELQKLKDKLKGK